MNPSESMPAPRSDNPVGARSRPDWQINLIMDVAIGVDTDVILDAYDLQVHQFEAISKNALFQAEVARVKKELERDGMSFKTKARVQAEAMLERSWAMVHSNTTPAAVAADLIKATARWAGYDGHGAAGATGGAQFAININLSSANQSAEVTIEHEAEDE